MLSRNIEDVKKNKIKFLEIKKDTMSKMKNILDGVNTDLLNAEEKIGELGDSDRKYPEWIQREKRQNANKWTEPQWDVGDFKWPHRCVTRNPKGRRMQKKWSEVVLDEKSPKWVKTYGPTDPNTRKHKHKKHEENSTRNKSNSFKPGIRTKS